jgi:ribose 5-phosphate isomerase B
MQTKGSLQQFNLIFASDHAGFDLKNELYRFYSDQKEFTNFAIKSTFDCGTYTNESCDYPDLVHKAAFELSSLDLKDSILDNRIMRIKNFLILVCGSGSGVCITANRHKNIRAVVCYNNEIAKLSRLHNNANCICFGQKFCTLQNAKDILNTFLTTNFEGGRHENRVIKISTN